MEFWCLKPGVQINPNLHAYNACSVPILNAVDLEHKEWGKKKYSPGLYRMRCVILGRLLNYGQYIVSALIVQDISLMVARRKQAITFHVDDDGFER